MLYVQKYTGKKGPRTKITGTREEFEAADIDTEGCEVFQSKSGEKLCKRGLPEDMEVDVKKTDAFNESEVEKVPQHFREWMLDFENAEMMLEALMSFGKAKVTQWRIAEAGLMHKAESKVVVHLLRKDHFLDSKDRLNHQAIDELKAIDQIIHPPNDEIEYKEGEDIF